MHSRSHLSSRRIHTQKELAAGLQIFRDNCASQAQGQEQSEYSNEYASDSDGDTDDDYSSDCRRPLQPMQMQQIESVTNIVMGVDADAALADLGGTLGCVPRSRTSKSHKVAKIHARNSNHLVSSTEQENEPSGLGWLFTTCTDTNTEDFL